MLLDLCHVNQYLFKSKFPCEDVYIAREVLNPVDFMFSFDLQSGYHPVEIFPEHRQYLSFSWTLYPGSPDTFNFQSCSSALVPRLIYLPSFSSH